MILSEKKYPENKTIHQLFQEQVERTPDRIALAAPGRELTDSMASMTYMTYKDLSEKSNRMAAMLVKRGVTPGDIIAIMGERSLETVVGMLGILKAGGAYLPIDPSFPQERINFILADSGAKLLVTNQDITDAFTLDTVDEGTGHSVSLQSAHLAYIIYTSGSTGRPKGVMVEHGGVVNVLLSYGHQYRIGEGTRVLQLSAFTFDPSVEQIFGPLLFGGEVYLAQEQIIGDTDRLRKYIEENRLNIVNFVPGVLDQLLGHGDKIGCVDAVISGAEALKDSVKDRLIERGYALYNHYGPTEATIEVLRGRMSRQDVNLGRPIPGIRCYVLDPQGRELADGEPGELCISGAGLAAGYLNNPLLTAEKFIENPFVHDGKEPMYSRLYKTGDMVRLLADGTYEFFGRIDHQVKIRGYRIEPGEIENRLLDNGNVKEAVVIAREHPSGDKYLCAYVTGRGASGAGSLNTFELRNYLSTLLPDYMIPSFFVLLEKIPVGPNGKTDIGALPEPAAGDAVREYIAPRDEVEERIVALWAGALEMDAGRIGIEDDFYSLGGHSLKATLSIMEIQKEFNIKISFTEMFKITTVKGLARRVKKAMFEEKYEAINPVGEKEYYQLSSAQKRLYILQQMDVSSTSYNMPVVYVMEGRPDIAVLEKAFHKLIHRHESLRTSFHMIGEEPVQKVHGHVPFKIDYIAAGNEVSDERLDEMINDFVKPFDLSRAPLIRVGLLKIAETKHLMVVDIHHIVTDGVSNGIFIKDFTALYRGETLPLLPVNYRDYAWWQTNQQQTQALKEQETYWLEEFRKEVPPLTLPLDYPRPSLKSFEGDTIIFEIEENVTDGLKRTAMQNGATLFMVLMAAYNVLLFKYSRAEDIVVGVPMAGRLHPDLQDIIGMFANTVALRNCPQPQQTFRNFLESVKEKSLTAFKNQDYQFDQLIDRLGIKREAGRNPLFDTMFVLQNMAIGDLEIQGRKLIPYDYQRKQSTFDITMEGFEKDGTIRFYLEYCTRLFKRETIEKMTVHFKNILRQVSENPSILLGDIDMATSEEKEQVLVQFNTISGGDQYDFD